MATMCLKIVSMMTLNNNNWCNIKLCIQTKIVLKSNDELLNLVTIHEMHYESECSNTEDVHASIITAQLICLILFKYIIQMGSNIFL